MRKKNLKNATVSFSNGKKITSLACDSIFLRTKLAILWRHDIHVEIHCLTIRKVYDKEKCHTLSPFLSYWPYCSHFPSPFPCFFPRPPPPPALRRRRHGNRGGGETGNRPRPEETNMLLLACQNRKPKPCFCCTYNREKEKRSFMVTNTPTCKKRKGLLYKDL